MTRSFHILVVLLLSSICLAQNTPAKPKSGTQRKTVSNTALGDYVVQGKVTDLITGDGLATATVEAVDIHKAHYRTLTDSNGFYKLEHLPRKGKLVLACSQLGYSPNPTEGVAEFKNGIATWNTRLVQENGDTAYLKQATIQLESLSSADRFEEVKFLAANVNTDSKMAIAAGLQEKSAASSADSNLMEMVAALTRESNGTAHGHGLERVNDDIATTRQIQAKLDKSQFKNVKIYAKDGIATLTGTVDLYEYKIDADRRAHKVKGVNAVRNEVRVAGNNVSDDELKQKLQEKLGYDRVGYGNVFNAISLNVQGGVVTMAGHARTDVDKDSALALVGTYPGVKDVVDDVQVDPVSILDDQLRLQVARAIYGYPVLNKYAVDPGKPIRILVHDGNVELYGIVNSTADRDIAGTRANSVQGVFNVKNNLQVTSEAVEKPKD